MKTVGQLDQQNPDVLRHRDHELAEVLRMLRLLRLQLDASQLGDAVDEARDLRPEESLQFLQRRIGVLDHVVQQSGHDGIGVELEVGEDPGDLDRMGEIGVARGTALGSVPLHGIDVGLIEPVFVGSRVIGGNPFDQLELAQHTWSSGAGLFRSTCSNVR